MKDNTTFQALIEAIHRNQADTFIDLVNNCDDLFGHDAEGHSLMWHARQSSNPVFAETLDLLAAGGTFTEENTPEPAPSEEKEEYVNPFAAPTPSESTAAPSKIWESRKEYTAAGDQASTEKPESAVPVTPPDDNRDEPMITPVAKLGRGAASKLGYDTIVENILVAKRGWGAAVVILALLVSAYPFFLLSHVKEIHVWGFGVFLMIAACAANIFNACVTLRHLFEPSTEPNGVPCGFIPWLNVSFVLAAGALSHEGMADLGNETYIWVPFGILLLLSFAHGFYYYCCYATWENECEFDEKFSFFLVMCCGLMVLLSAGYLVVAYAENNHALTGTLCFVLIVVSLFFQMGRWGAAERGDMNSDDDIRVFGDRYLGWSCLGGGIGICLIAVIWNIVLLGAAEYASYHEMPAVVEWCLPHGNTKLSPIQKTFFVGAHWYDNVRYAMRHGDVRSARAVFWYLYRHDNNNRNFHREFLRELSHEVNILPLCGGGYCAVDWDEEGFVKQISFDEPKMLDMFMYWAKKEDEDVFIKAIVKHSARKDALYLTQTKGCDATYGKEKQTLLQAAVNGKNPEIVELLLKKEANPDFSESGNTPLQAAVKGRNPEIVELLLKYGADPDYAKSGKTPQRMAEEMKWVYVLKLFNDFRYKAQ